MSENGSVKSIDSKSALRETGVVTGFVLDSDSDAKAVVDVATYIITDKAKPANDLKDLFIRIPLFLARVYFWLQYEYSMKENKCKYKT